MADRGAGDRIVRQVLIDCLNRHNEAIQEARWNVTHHNADNLSAALVDLDETCRELFSTESGGT